MLDLNHVRENSQVVKENLKKRNPELITLVDDLLDNDEKWKNEKQKNDVLRSRRNKISEEINTAKKKGKDVSSLIKEVKELPQKIEESNKTVDELQKKIKQLLLTIPNILHQSVPLGKDSTENKVIKVFGKTKKLTFQKSHADLLPEKGLIDLERAAKISGARWYFLKGKLAQLELALSKYAVDFMIKKGYTFVIPPHAMNYSAYEGVTNVDAFKEALYKIDGENLFLIATSEHPLTAQFKDEVINEKDLPIKFVGLSPCYRKEAGAHGKDMKGIFRVHQFNKVEQVIICKPEDSLHLHEELLKNAVEFWKSLELPFRQIVLCSGDTGIVMAKTYDLEVWMPVQKEYREVCSCSNATDYQANRLNIRYSIGEERKKVHTLNSTCVATTRALVAIVENFQNEKGEILIPKVLQKYCGFKKI